MRALTYQWDLLSNLVQRDIKLHYRRSVLGILWAQLNPLLSLLIFSFIFGKVIPLNIPNYTAYVFTGLLAWNWFSSTVSMANYSLSNSRDLVRKPQFQNEMIIVVSVTTNLVNFLLAMPVLVGVLLFNNLIPNWTLLFLPFVLAVEFCFVLGLALLVSATNVFFRDILHIVTVLVQVWFYVTPIFYAVSPQNEYAYLINLNPMTHIVNSYRRIFLDRQPPDFLALGVVFLVALAVLGLGWTVFNRLKYSFVDEM